MLESLTLVPKSVNYLAHLERSNIGVSVRRCWHMKANDYLLNQITVCSRQSLLDIHVDFLHDAQHPTCNGLPKLDAPFPLDPVPNDLSPKGHDPITGQHQPD